MRQIVALCLVLSACVDRAADGSFYAPVSRATCPSLGIQGAQLQYRLSSRDTIIYLLNGTKVPVSQCYVTTKIEKME